MEQYEALPGGLRLRSGGFPLGTDTMVLADFVRLKHGANVCDLGCGGGALGLLLCAKEPSCRVTGVELDGAACGAAEENFSQSALSGRCTLVRGDVRKIRSLLPAGAFTAVVSNPPYFPNALPASPDSERASARSESGCTLDALCSAAAWALQNGGRFSLVYRADGLCDLICALRGHGLEPKRLRSFRHDPNTPVKRILLEARKGGKPGLIFEPELILRRSNGAPSVEFQRIYHEGGN